MFLTTFGILALISGSVGFFAGPYAISTGIKSFMNLAEGGMLYSRYMHPTSGIQPSYFLFSIKNPKAVLMGGKASFSLKGPYVFESRVRRAKIKFGDQGQKVSFETGRSFSLSEAESADMDERMWLINPVTFMTAEMSKSMLIDRVPFRSMAEPLIWSTLSAVLDSFNEQPIIQTTPRRMLIGREVQMLQGLSSMGVQYGLGNLVPNKMFGLVTEKNESHQLYTGVGLTREKFAEVARYRGEKKMTVWRGDQCNRIAGTNGELYKPLAKPGKSIEIFSGALCRTIQLEAISGQPVRMETGVKALEYEMSPRMYLGARQNSDKTCFCEDLRTYDCQYDGLLAMGPCLKGAPVYLSRANFLDVDLRIRDLVDWRSSLVSNGTGVNERLSISQMVKIEPLTGLVLEFEMTMMALIKMVRNKNMKALVSVQPLTYMPLFAVRESFKLPDYATWPLSLLQGVNDYQGIATSLTALFGAGILVVSRLVGRTMARI